MAARFSDSWLEELRSRVPLEEVVSEYVSMRPKGHRLWGCCPFHSEKTPSFSVDTTTQMYYCFGCHKGGTVITFIQETERVEFPEAVKMLAERAHMPLPEDNFRPEKRSGTPRDRLYEANRAAARFYHDLLWKSEGAEALKYLYKRGMTDQDIRRFGLGASADAWDALKDELTGQGFTEKELVEAGLCVDRTGRAHDMFRNRVMFPIINAQGKVIGFGGRALGNAEPKYMNTGDTPVFNKRQGLYALNFAKSERDQGRLILVEGYMDVCSLRKYGIKAVVATLGTALTEEQARLMKRYAPEVLISYDGDGAGHAAALRALDIFDRAALPAKVVDYPEGMDPDDFVKANGPEGFEKLKKYRPYEYRMLRAADGLDLRTGEGMTEYVKKCCAVLKNTPSPIERENGLRELAHRSGYSESVIREQIGFTAAQEEKPRVRQPFRRAEEKASATPAQKALLTIMTTTRLPEGLAVPEDLPEGVLREAARQLLDRVPIGTILDGLDEGPDKDELITAVQYEPLSEEPEERVEAAHSYVTAIRRERLENEARAIEDRIAEGVSEAEKNELYGRLMKIYDRLNQ